MAAAMELSAALAMTAPRRIALPRTCVPLLRRQKQRVALGSPRASLEIVEPLSSSPAPDLTWQIVAGAVAGVTPFVVAGIEFSKRIIQQRRCQVCSGSGLVKRAGILVRCNVCGGFLPWQSWSRFFSSGR